MVTYSGDSVSDTIQAEGGGLRAVGGVDGVDLSGILNSAITRGGGKASSESGDGEDGELHLEGLMKFEVWFLVLG